MKKLWSFRFLYDIDIYWKVKNILLIIEGISVNLDLRNCLLGKLFCKCNTWAIADVLAISGKSF